MNDTEFQPLRNSSPAKTNASYFRLTQTLTAALIAFIVVPLGVADASTRNAPARLILKQRPLAPTDINLFSPAAYPGATPLAPAAGPPPTTQQVQQMLKTYMQEQLPSNPKARKRAMDLFNSPDLIARIPNPSLRAGLVGLEGTSGELSMNFILNEKNLCGFA